MAMTIAFHTLGCKVNQYDTQVMRERFLEAGYEERAFDGIADVYLINTCAVTGEGARKSMQAARRAHARNPEAKLILAGCLAQNEAEKAAFPGVDLIIGTQRRGEVVTLFEEAVAASKPSVAVAPLEDAPFEGSGVSAHEGRARAVLKIQEGCDNACAYCIIPAARGRSRSMSIASVGENAGRLFAAGYRELVLTGIHINSFGGDGAGVTLADAVDAAEHAGFTRVRLGSLDPRFMDGETVKALAAHAALCPQFHLSLQSGCDAVLRRMKRGYDTAEYLRVCGDLRDAFPGCAITTDIICGFPGETDAEHAATLDFIRTFRPAKVHAFPFSPREGTPAASMEQLPHGVGRARAKEVIALSEEMENAFAAGFVGKRVELLPETVENGVWEGYTREYVRARMRLGCEPDGAVAATVTAVRDRVLVLESAP